MCVYIYAVFLSSLPLPDCNHAATERTEVPAGGQDGGELGAGRGHSAGAVDPAQEPLLSQGCGVSSRCD